MKHSQDAQRYLSQGIWRVEKKMNTFEELWGVSVLEQKKNRTLARVHYEKLNDGTFLITGLVGFIRESEISEKYHPRVLERYIEMEHVMFGGYSRGSENYPAVYFKGMAGPGLQVGEVYSKEEFSAVIAKAKLCGSALSRAIKEAKAAIKVIEI